MQSVNIASSVLALFGQALVLQSYAAEPMNRAYICEANGVRAFVDETDFGKVTNASCTEIEYRARTPARVYSCPQGDGKTIFTDTQPLKVGTKPCKLLV